MKKFHLIARTVAIVLSVVFALLLFPTIVGIHGGLKSAAYTLLGIAVIWVFYFGLGALFSSLYEEGKKDGDNADFV